MSKGTTLRLKSVSWGDRALVVLVVVMVICVMLLGAVTVYATTASQPSEPATEMVEGSNFCGGWSSYGGDNCINVSRNS